MRASSQANNVRCFAPLSTGPLPLSIGSALKDTEAGVKVGYFTDQHIDPLVNAGFQREHPAFETSFQGEHPRFKAAHSRGKRVEQKSVPDHSQRDHYGRQADSKVKLGVCHGSLDCS